MLKHISKASTHIARAATAAALRADGGVADADGAVGLAAERVADDGQVHELQLRGHRVAGCEHPHPALRQALGPPTSQRRGQGAKETHRRRTCPSR